MESKKYTRVDAETKIKALREHMTKGKPVSDICKEFGVQPSNFHHWQQELFARGASVFEGKMGRKPVDRSAERIADLEAKLAKKDSVIAELLEEHVKLKKSLGES
jgi:transposase-like protein